MRRPAFSSRRIIGTNDALLRGAGFLVSVYFSINAQRLRQPPAHASDDDLGARQMTD